MNRVEEKIYEYITLRLNKRKTKTLADAKIPVTHQERSDNQVSD
jgi:hypothetical protein